MACYTCIGDDGTTSIIGRCNIEKDDTRIEVLGCFDELNAVVGVAGTFSDSEDAMSLLKTVQDDIHTICAEIAAVIDNMPRITEKHVERIEKIIDDAERSLEPQRSFIFPGGNKEAALLHLARTVSRRAERQLVRLAKKEETNPFLLKYANRLSSLFHVMARVENKKGNIKEEKPTYKYYNRD
ncbi:cob(I)yrinic acid a,c-diamide adenosyltransferase [Candidatus Woesearchaeota archaeon]|nr:cob(I)yrinic acid a,c-diamide adenosyltransferase [Candidatus Woesearchaeota archaeon]